LLFAKTGAICHPRFSAEISAPSSSAAGSIVDSEDNPIELKALCFLVPTSSSLTDFIDSPRKTNGRIHPTANGRGVDVQLI
jgi:hypothetical protein